MFARLVNDGRSFDFEVELVQRAPEGEGALALVGPPIVTETVIEGVRTPVKLTMVADRVAYYKPWIST